MNDDDLLNLILGNNTNGPSATSFANNLGQGTGAGSPPLSSLFSTGLGGDVIASMLPQRDNANAALPPADTSAAFLSPSSLRPPSALYDPNPPAPSMGQLALMLGVPPEVVAAIGDQAKRQAVFDVGSKAVLGPATEAILPEIGVPTEIARAAATTIDIANHISEPSDEQYIQDAPDKAVFNYLNDTKFQTILSAAKAWIP